VSSSFSSLPLSFSSPLLLLLFLLNLCHRLLLEMALTLVSSKPPVTVPPVVIAVSAVVETISRKGSIVRRRTKEELEEEEEKEEEEALTYVFFRLLHCPPCQDGLRGEDLLLLDPLSSLSSSNSTYVDVNVDPTAVVEVDAGDAGGRRQREKGKVRRERIMDSALHMFEKNEQIKVKSCKKQHLNNTISAAGRKIQD
jgi:hypothetical protein